MKQLTSLDAQFLAVEDGRAHGHVMTLGIYDPSTASTARLDRQAVRDLVQQRLHLLTPLRLRLVEVPFGLDHPYWIEDPELDVDRHVHEHDLSPPGDDRALAELIADIASRPLDRSKPLWEFHVIQGVSGERVAFLTKLHHAAVDGTSWSQLSAALLDPSATPRDVARGDVPGERLPRSAEMLLRGVGGLPRQPVRFVQGLPRALPHLDLVPNLGSLPGVHTVAGLARRASRIGGAHDGAVLDGPKARAPRTRFNRRISGGRQVAFGSMPLTEVKAVKDAFGVTVNDVVMGIVSGALRDWLEQRGELPAGPLVGLVPVSVATADRASFGNQIGMLCPALPTDEADPVQRLVKIADAMRAVKERHRAVPATLLQDANNFIPPAMFARAARATTLVATEFHMGVSANLLVSNVPGPTAPMYLAGARLEAQYPLSAIFHGLGLNITVVSYRDHMDWGVICDANDDDAAWSLMDELRASQAELVAAVAKPSRSAAPRRSTRATHSVRTRR